MFANGDAKPVNPVLKNLVGLRSIFICGQCGYLETLLTKLCFVIPVALLDRSTIRSDSLDDSAMTKPRRAIISNLKLL